MKVPDRVQQELKDKTNNGKGNQTMGMFWELPFDIKYISKRQSTKLHVKIYTKILNILEYGSKTEEKSLKEPNINSLVNKVQRCER